METTIFQYGIQGVLAFGAVGFLTKFLESRFKILLTGEYKFYLLVVLAFVFGFIPADLGNWLLEEIKVAVAVGVGIHALWTVRKA